MSTQASKKTLLGEILDVMRRLHFSIHTEKAYCGWISRFIKFHHIQDRNVLLVTPKNKIEAFLTYLAVKANVAASTQNLAFNALIFLYRRILDCPVEGIESAKMRKEKRIPVVLTRDEVKLVLQFMQGTPELVVKLLYGSGLRITEGVRLRVQDIDYGYKQITVRDGKGIKDQVTPFPGSLLPILNN